MSEGRWAVSGVSSVFRVIKYPERVGISSHIPARHSHIVRHEQRCIPWSSNSVVVITRPDSSMTFNPIVIDTVIDRDVALVDDDTMSGWNLERARVHLEGLGARVHPVAALALDTGPNVDVIDASDFLVKGDYGLMTVSLDGHIRRIPYTMPGVNPVQRAGVPQSALLEFAQMAQRLRSIEMSALAPKSC